MEPDIALVAVNASYSHTNLAIRYLKRIADDYRLGTICLEYTINDQILRIADELIIINPRVLALSCYIWNYEAVLKIIERVKLACPQIFIMIGGPQVINCDRQWMEEHPEVDLVLTGAGEESFRIWCELYQNGNNNLSNIPGSWWRSPEGNIKNNYVNKRQVVIGTADYGNEDLKNHLVYYETSRGCAYKCAYCLSSLDRQVQNRDLDQVKIDLTELANSGVRTVKLVDRTFNINEKRARDIIDYWCSLPGDCCLHCEMVADIMSSEFVDYLAELPAGRLQFEIGIQSTNPDSLKAVNRHMDWQYTAQVVKKLVAAGNIHVHLDLLVGLPYEDWPSLAKSFNAVYDLQPQHLQIGMLKILPGTLMQDLAADMAYQYSHFPPYELVSNPWLHAGEVVKLHHLSETMDKLYNNHDMAKAHNELIKRYPTAFDYWVALSGMAWRSGMFTAARSNDAWSYLPVKLAQEQWGDQAAALVEQQVQLVLLLKERRYHFSHPYTDRALPDREYHQYRGLIEEKWPQLQGLNLKDFKRRVVVHYLPLLRSSGDTIGLTAFLYPQSGIPCLDYFSW